MCHSSSSRWRSWRLPFGYRVWMLIVSFLPMFWGRDIAMALSDPDRTECGSHSCRMIKAGAIMASWDIAYTDAEPGSPSKGKLGVYRGYVPTSLCRPSLASLITGLYPHQHGSWGTIRGTRGPQREARYALHRSCLSGSSRAISREGR